jgi:hypothetical protein
MYNFNNINCSSLLRELNFIMKYLVTFAVKTPQKWNKASFYDCHGTSGFSSYMQHKQRWWLLCGLYPTASVNSAQVHNPHTFTCIFYFIWSSWSKVCFTSLGITHLDRRTSVISSYKYFQPRAILFWERTENNEQNDWISWITSFLKLWNYHAS